MNRTKTSLAGKKYAALGLLVVCMASTVFAVDLEGNVSLNGGATLTATPDSIESQADNFTYKWSDKNGDGVADEDGDAGAGGLLMAEPAQGTVICVF